jgi:hypothetical protein
MVPKKNRLSRSVLLQQLILIYETTAKLLSFDSAINENMEMSWLLHDPTQLIDVCFLIFRLAFQMAKDETEPATDTPDHTNFSDLCPTGLLAMKEQGIWLQFQHVSQLLFYTT